MLKKQPQDVVSLHRFNAQQLAGLTGPMEHEDLLAFWLFIGRYATSNVVIVIPPTASYVRMKTS